MRVPIILGTPTIGRVVNVMREAEIDALAMPWANARVAHLLAIRRMTPVEVGGDREEGCEMDQDSSLMHTQKAETLEPFSSHVIPVRIMEAYLGECLNIMVQGLHAQDGTLPPGITVQNTYTELRKGKQEGSSGGVEQHQPTPRLSRRRPLCQGQWPCNWLPDIHRAWESTS